jgi:sensory rhodopsin
MYQDVITRLYYSNAVMLFVLFVYVFSLSFFLRPNRRLIYYFMTQISLMGGLFYIVMADRLLDFEKPDGRIVHVGRYIEWLLATPSQLLILGGIGRFDSANIYAINLYNFIMILCGLLGDWNDGVLRYVYFSIGIFLFLPVYIFLFEDFDEEMVRSFAGEYFSKRYYWVGKYLLLSWILYPVVWMLYAKRVLDELGQAVSYTVLDFFSKVVFQLWVLEGLRRQRVVPEIHQSVPTEM